MYLIDVMTSSFSELLPTSGKLVAKILKYENRLNYLLTRYNVQQIQ